MKTFISLSIVFCALLCVRAQPPKQYTFTHYSTGTGLQSNQVNSIAQDEAGYIWIATREGLVRFDGTRYKTFQHNDNDSASIPSNSLLQVLPDKHENLWLLTTRGRAGIFNTKNFSFHEVAVKPKNGSSLKTVFKKLIQDEYGNVFLLLAKTEILMWNKKRNDFTALANFFPVKEEWAFSGFVQQPGTQKYWMGIQDGGLVIYNKATGNLSYAGNNTENEPAIEPFKTLTSLSNFMFDKKGRFWFVSWTPEFPFVYCFNPHEKQAAFQRYEFYSTFKAYNEINGIFEQRDGTIWIRGLNVFGRYLEVEKRFELVHAGYENERSIDYRLITCLYEDREMNIWVGTGINGAFRFNPSQEFFYNIQYINRKSGKNGDGSIEALYPEPNGTLLVAIMHDGLYRYDKNFNNIPLNIKGIPDKNFTAVWSISPSSRDSNTVWFASQPGLYKYNSRQQAAVHYNPAVLAGKLIRQVTEDKNGNLWLGLDTMGVFVWNATKGKTVFDKGISKFDAIPSVKINQIKTDAKGWVWIATASAGLYVVDPDTENILLHFDEQGKNEQHLMEESVNAVLEYNDSLMVITTPSRILIYNRYRKRTRILGTQQTISGNTASVEKDGNGNLWISTTTALYRATPKTRVFIHFNRDDGITNDYFLLSSSCKLPDGRILFGAVGQFVVFNPADVLVSIPPPDISITDFKVMNRSLPVDSLLQLQQIELGYEKNSLTVDFSTLTYVSAHLIQYKMVNIDKDWKTADKNYQAIYSYLPPGGYELQFQTIDADGKVKTSLLKLKIKIDAPFWKTWWFYSLLLLLSGAVLFWLDKARMKRKETVQKMRSSIAGNLHEEINIALNNINILSEMAKMKAAREPEKSKEFIDQIHNKSHTMIIAMDDMLWSISPDNDSMEKTVARMQEFIDSMNNRRGTNNEMLTDDRVRLLNLDMHFRHEAFLLFKESVSALLNAGVLFYRIQIMMDKINLLYRISFDCDGCDKRVLTNMLEKLETGKHAAAINARLQLQMPGNSAVLEIKMPVV